MYNRLVEGLFATKALRISPENQPFWYTSGKLGPFYINTHFLYGSEEKATRLLQRIDVLKTDIEQLHQELYACIMENYETDPIFHQLIEDMVTYVKEHISLEDIAYISGGERRDWFFSLPVAERLNKKHITIFKDLSMVVFEQGTVAPVTDIQGANVLHIADLITEASSYERAWIPAIASIHGTLTDSLVVVDRNQGGRALLETHNIRSHALCGINFELFVKAAELGCISPAQCVMVKEYLENPDLAMKNFVKAHPDFMDHALYHSDAKTAERAKLCIEKGFYS